MGPKTPGFQTSGAHTPETRVSPRLPVKVAPWPMGKQQRAPGMSLSTWLGGCWPRGEGGSVFPFYLFSFFLPAASTGSPFALDQLQVPSPSFFSFSSSTTYRLPSGYSNQHTPSYRCPAHGPQHPQSASPFTCCPAFLPGAWVWWLTPRGRSFSHLVPEARGTCVLGFRGIITTRDSSWQTTPPPGHRTHSRLTHTPSLSVKVTYSLVRELQPEGPGAHLAHIQKSKSVGGQYLGLKTARQYLLERSLYIHLEP